MKKRKKFNFRIVVVIFLVIIVFLLLLIKLNKEASIPITSEELDLSIQVPSHYTVNQQFHMISITDHSDEIIMSRYGSSHKNLDEHLKDLSKKNNVKIDISEKIPHDEYEIYKVIINHYNSPQPKDITDFIYVDHTIYTFQANSEELYTDLDAIVKSFRYNP